MRLNISVEDKYAHRFDGWFDVQEQLEQLGWVIGRDLPEFDIEMIQTQLLGPLFQRNDPRVQRPFIVYERSGSASIHPPSWRLYVTHPNVLGYAKETGFRDKNTYNLPHLDGRFHHTLISSETPELPEPQLGQEDLDKVETIFQIYAHKVRYDLVKLQKNKKFRHRTTDVLFSGTSEYDVELITQHRALCCQRLLELKEAKTLIGSGRCLSPENWSAVLRDSKIFVSPYGYGEYSWKDFESIFAGCVLIKPTSGFVTTHGFDIYLDGAYCVECKPDFSDLGAVVDDILTNEAKWSDFAFKARAALEAALVERDNRAKDIAGFLNACVNRIKA